MPDVTPILILAAGTSSRMRGRDKLLEPVAGVPLIRRLASEASRVGPAFVALPAHDHPRAAALAGLDVTILAVPEATEGMGASLRGAVAQLPVCAGFLVLLGDLPEITADDIRTVIGDGTGDALVRRGATEDGRPGHPILFDAALRPAFAALSGDEGAATIVRTHRARTRLVPLPGMRALRDLDTPEAWAAWRRETGG